MWAYDLLRRSLGLVLLINFVSATPQLVVINRLQPVRRLLRAARRDAPTRLHAVARFPSSLWISSSGAAIWVTGGVGMLSALAIVTTSCIVPSCFLFGLCWVCWLSFVNTFGSLFWFPWDLLTCEIALLGMFSGGTVPSAQARFLFRLLLFRVMFGMGLARFRQLDDRSRDLTYTYHFLEWQPFPTKEARTLRELLPLLAHKASFLLFGVLELVLPWAALCASHAAARYACFVGLVGLQAAIMWTGNFGCFNIATAALCWPLLAEVDAEAAPSLLGCAGWALVGVYTLVALPFVLCTTSWDHAIWLNRPSQLPWWMPGRLAKLLRVLAPLRLWNSYGVFIRRGNVPHQVPVLQMKAEACSQQWVDIEPHWLVCNPDEAPRRFAPHHPRIDHYLFYANFKPEDLKLPCLVGTNPYYLSPYCLTELLVTALLRGDADAWSFFAPPCQRPAAIRHAAYHYVMLPPGERRERGAFWQRELVGVGPAMVLSDREAFAERHGHGVRDRWELFIFDTFTIDRDDALCVAGERLNPPQVAVRVPKGKEPPRSRSVVDKLAKVKG